MHSSKSLRSILNGKYATAEKLLPLRHPDRERLFNLFEEIEVHTEELFWSLESEHLNNSELVENVRCNKTGFDSHEDECCINLLIKTTVIVLLLLALLYL